MEAIILPKDQFQDLISKVNQISNRIEKLVAIPGNDIIDNAEFIRIMKISKRTAQTWRDEKVISFSQIGAKVYYKFSDIEKLLKNNLHSSTNLD